MILVIAEHNNQTLRPVTLNTLAAAQQLGDEIHVLLAGFECEPVLEELKKIDCISKLFFANAEDYQYPLAESLAPLIVEVGKTASHILAPATTFGKNVMPRVAAMLDVGQVSDIIEIIDPKTFKRPIYAGNAIATVQSSDPVQIITVRTTAFDPVTVREGKAEVVSIDFNQSNVLSTFIKADSEDSGRPELTSADVVISGGRGLKDKAGFERLEKIADKMGAAMGASRAAVDAGFAPNEYQVGQTGQIVAPKVYIAVGISGAIQHLAGMKDSKVIFAINKDPDAPIFEVADYGLVADIFTLLPEWEAAV